MPSIEGMDRLLAKIATLGGNVNKSLATSVHQSVKLVQGTAKAGAPVNDGFLHNNIYEEVRTEGDKIEGRVYTNVDYAPYVEFGTGPVGMASDKGDLPMRIINQLVYKQNGWWIHESQIDAETAEKYHFERRETDQGVFYYTEGQPAQPFMYPAISQNEQKIERLIKKKLRDDIRRLAGES